MWNYSASKRKVNKKKNSWKWNFFFFLDRQLDPEKYVMLSSRCWRTRRIRSIDLMRNKNRVHRNRKTAVNSVHKRNTAKKLKSHLPCPRWERIGCRPCGGETLLVCVYAVIAALFGDGWFQLPWLHLGWHLPSSNPWFSFYIQKRTVWFEERHKTNPGPVAHRGRRGYGELYADVDYHRLASPVGSTAAGTVITTTRQRFGLLLYCGFRCCSIGLV